MNKREGLVNRINSIGFGQEIGKLSTFSFERNKTLK